MVAAEGYKDFPGSVRNVSRSRRRIHGVSQGYRGFMGAPGSLKGVPGGLIGVLGSPTTFIGIWRVQERFIASQ